MCGPAGPPWGKSTEGAAMASEELEALESLDLGSLTLADVASLKNPTLRRAIITALESGLDAGATHTNHWAFQSHAQAVALPDRTT